MKHWPGTIDQISLVLMLRHELRLSYDGTLAALDSELQPGECPSSPWLGAESGGARSWDGVRDLGKAARQGFPLWASGWRAWGWGCNYCKSWTDQLNTGPPSPQVVWRCFEPGETAELRDGSFWYHDWRPTLYMQLLIGLLSLKEFTELALSFKEQVEKQQLFT